MKTRITLIKFRRFRVNEPRHSEHSDVFQNIQTPLRTFRRHSEHSDVFQNIQTPLRTFRRHSEHSDVFKNIQKVPLRFVHARATIEVPRLSFLRLPDLGAQDLSQNLTFSGETNKTAIYGTPDWTYSMA